VSSVRPRSVKGRRPEPRGPVAYCCLFLVAHALGGLTARLQASTARKQAAAKALITSALIMVEPRGESVRPRFQVEDQVW
jgi:hypothetical protein